MANEKRLIDAVALADEVFTIYIHATGMRNGKTILIELLEKYRNEVLRAICKAPTVDAVEVVHGVWVEVSDGVAIGKGTHFECSACRTWTSWGRLSNYCPKCGAKMNRGEEA